MRIPTIWLAALLLAPGTFRAAAEPLVLNLAAAQEMAARNNLAIRASEAEQDIKKRQQSTAWNSLLPSLSGRAGLSYSPAASDSLVAQSASALSASLSAGFSLSAALAFQIRDAALQYEAGAITLETARKQLERDVGKSFYNLLLMEEKIKLIRETIATAQKRYDLADAKYRKGLIPELDLLSAQVSLENLRPELEDAEVGYQTAQMQFKQSLGVERQAQISLQGQIEAPPLALDAEALVSQYLGGSLGVQSRVKSVQVLENQNKLLDAQKYGPTVSVSGSYSAGVEAPFAADWSDPRAYSLRGSLGVTLSVPLDGWLPASQARVQARNLQDSITAARLQLAQTLRETEDQIVSLVLDLQKSVRKIAVLQQNVTLAQKSYDLTERQYEAGVSEAISVDDAFNALLQARLNVLSEQYNYTSALFDLEYTLNAKLRS